MFFLTRFLLLTIFELFILQSVPGHTTTDMTYFSVGSKETEPDAYPWTVAIYKTTGIGTEYICGGSLLTRHHVITGKLLLLISQVSLYI